MGSMATRTELPPGTARHELPGGGVLFRSEAGEFAVAAHEQVVFLSVRTAEVPYVTEAERSSIERIADGFHQVVLNYGFMEDAHVPRALGRIKGAQVTFRPMETTYFLGRETLIPSKRRRGMWLWREKLFSVMSRNARSAASFFRLPPNRVVELGAQVEL